MCSDCLVSSQALGPAGSAASSILERLWSPMERQILYLLRYRSNVKAFREQAKQLNISKKDLQTLVDYAREKGEDIKTEVRSWIEETIRIENDVDTLEKDIKQSKGCCHDWKLDWRTRYRLGRLARKKANEINHHLSKKPSQSVSFPARPANLTSLPTPEFVDLEASSKALNSIMEALKDEEKEKNIIGVFGNGGIGKTTLMKQVAKRVKEQTSFSEVILVTVTQTPNLIRIQDETAKLLGFELEGDIQYQRAATLSERLKQRQRLVVILDDLWEKLDLAAVGIPYDKENNGCKIIVTSRFSHVCDEMGSYRKIEIEQLTDQDRLKLFKIKAGLPDSNDFDRAAEEVLDKCGKLPNSIVLIATALRNKPVNEWNEAIKRKRESTEINVEGIPEEVVLCVTLGYDRLEKAAKGCLQFSCLFPPYYNLSIEELVICALVDRLFPDVSSLAEVRQKIHPVLERLKSSNLLLEGDREGCYRIHDDTRKVVKFIASKEGNNVISEAGLQNGWPNEDLQKCEKLSLMDSNVTKLPDRPKCPQLLTLFLQNNALEDIPTCFFHHMRELNFLDLSYTNISSLPASFECLVKLYSLRLENTHLRDASFIKEFDKLEILTLRGSSIEQLPKGLEKMVNLKLLDLSNNLFLKGIPYNVISKLSRLEELYIGNSFGDWEVEGKTNQQKASFSEVASLAHLTVLYIHVKNTNALSIDFDGPWENLKRFRVCVNNDYWEIASARSMHLKNLSSPPANWVKLLLGKTEYLTLTRSRDLEHTREICKQRLPELMCMNLRACSMHRILLSSLYPSVKKLEELHVEYCYSLKEVFSIEENEKERDGLKILRELILVGLPKLRSVWKGDHSIVQLENLKLMKVKECPKLRSLFSHTLAQMLHSLEHLAILKCNNMEAIVSNDNADLGRGAAKDMNSSSLTLPMFFINLQKLIIYKCHKMKSVLSLSVVQGLEQLKELNIAACNQMEVIITVSDEERKAEKRDLLSQLKILVVQDLPKLDTIYNGEMVLEWRQLEELQVWNCPNVKKLPMDSRSAENLREFRAEAAWLGGLQWNGEYTKCHLEFCLIKEE